MSFDPRAFPIPSFLPENAPFTPAQRAWLNGFFAGLITPGTPAGAVKPAAAKPAVTVLFASQTGGAESLAKKLAKAARERGHAAKPVDLGAIDLAAIAALGQVAVIASTYGEGDPPDGAKAFAAALERAEGQPLAGLRFAVLALGDRNYTHFCRFGALLDRRFGELGGTRLAELVEVDVDPDAPFAGFRDSVLGALADSPAGAETAAAAPADSDDDGDEPWSRERPFAARLLASTTLNGEQSDKETRHVVISLAGSGLAYAPGDALGVAASNGAAEVAALLAATGFAADAPVTVGDRSCRLDEALTHHLAIGKLSQATLIKFQKLADSTRLAPLLEPDNNAELERYLWGREAIDLISDFPRVLAGAQELATLLPRLAPRLYSIASSQRAHPDEVHLTVGVVRYTAHGRSRGGIASTMLADRLEPGQTVPVYLHRNARFRLPAEAERPVIMVGPGTGIAPFRAFLEERRAGAGPGRNWLFFGDRRAAQDFLYRRELEGFLADGTLSRLDTAFSRDGAGKVYVQDRMRENAAELWRWLQDGAHFYVCGDGARMAKDVDECLQEIVAAQGKMSRAEAKLAVEQLAAERRYCRDVY